MAEKRIDINLQIAGLLLPLKNTSLAEEGIFREAAKGINERWNQWRRNYPKASDLEALAIVALTYAKAYLTLKANISETEQALVDFEKKLDSMLNEGMSSQS
ncbi:MAG: cell division protein ZapA [Paramuribaculum sp.]|nr:cell division protein ZapA [Paramuribaculum sp.]